MRFVMGQIFRFSACGIALLMLSAGVAKATITVGSGPFTYNQTFDSLPASGTNNPWSQDSTLPGWFLYQNNNGNIAAFDAGTGSSNTGKFYSFGNSSDRALGGVGSGNAYFGSAPATGAIAGWWAVAFTNNSGTTLDKFTLGFDGEQWRNGGNTTAQTTVLEYGFGATFATVGSWTAPGGNFDFTGPIATATAAALDGNAAANRTAARGGEISGVTWNNSDTLWVRWVERNDAGNDHGLAIDNFSLSVSGTGGGAGNLTPATSSVTFPNRIVGTAASQAVTLNEVGGSPVNYTSSTDGAANVTAGGSGSVSAGGNGSITVGINTASAGAKSGNVTIADGNPTSDQIAVSGNVYDHSSAKFLSNGSSTLTLDLGSFAQGSGPHSIVDSIFNKLQTVGFTAELDFDSVAPGTGAVGVLSTDLTSGAFTALAASDAESPTPFPFNATLNANNAPGVYNASYQLKLSDADSYAGAGAVGSQTLTLNLTGTITGTTPVLAGDFNSDGKVDASDYAVWKKNDGANVALPNDNGVSNQAQRYDVWRTNFGNAGAGSGASLAGNSVAVPEPRAAVLLLVALVIGFDCYLARRNSMNRSNRFAA